MVGKATLFVVAAFSVVFLIVEFNLGNVSNRAVSNYVDYYLESYAHEMAVSGAELAANKLFLDPKWTEGFTNLDYKGGKINVKVDIVDAFSNTLKITSTAEYQTLKQTVEVVLVASRFSKYAYYSQSEGGNIRWMSKDTVWGPFHTQDYILTDGSPVFFGRVTTLKGVKKTNAWSDKPQFLGGYQSGVNVPMPTDATGPMKSIAESNGKKISGNDTVYITFALDSLKVRYTFKGTSTSYLASTFSPNGLIFVENAVVRLQGKVKGQFTVAVSYSSTNSGGKGSVYLDDDITYNTNPLTNPNSTDILGIVTKNDVIITQNAANNNNINIHASIFCESGSFSAQNYNNRPVSGVINLVGGIIQQQRGAVGTISGSSVSTGFSKSYRYDERLLYMSPPAFPGTGGYQIVSWYE